METVYFGMILIIFLLAIFDLVVGVSNDAVNFLNSAIGSKALKFKIILFIAACGVFCGATMSNGMMDIARHGIFRPEVFSFNSLMCIFVAVMVTDVVLLDVFNTLGLPTSTTVSMVFELLGGSVALALIHIWGGNGLAIGDMLNTEKAFSVIMGIFVSVAIAFVFGALVQYIARVIFTFNYKPRLKWTVGLFGGLAATSIIYFMLIKGIKNSTLMSSEIMEDIRNHTGLMVAVCFVVFSLLMQVLHLLHVNVFKVIVAMGTFSLAMAFAGNDLVNFIGVPLAGYSAFSDFAINGLGNADSYMMNSLNEPAGTPFLFLLAAGGIMVLTLVFSKKAHNVVKTSIGLSRQSEGDEMFGTSSVARSMVRSTTAVAETVSRYVPARLARWLDSRFRQEDVILEDGAAFDLVRASVNLVIASLLIALGTSLKLPLSTTYVTFIVAMGTSLADRAWGRESAVFRITGVLSVIGGWFITAGVAFAICFVLSALMFWGGPAVMAVLIALAIFLLIRSAIRYKKNSAAEVEDAEFVVMTTSKDSEAVWDALRSHTARTISEFVLFAADVYTQVSTAFASDDLKGLRRADQHLDANREKLKKLRRKEVIGLRRIDHVIAIERSTWFHLSSNDCTQMLYCLKRMTDQCREHVDNNFNPMPEDYALEFGQLRSRVCDLLHSAGSIISQGLTQESDEARALCKSLKSAVSATRKTHIERIQNEKTDLKVALVYLNMLQETQEILNVLHHLLRTSRKFQA